jgi:hypothetical protein
MAAFPVVSGGNEWRHISPTRCIRVSARLEQDFCRTAPVHGDRAQQRRAAGNVLVMQVAFLFDQQPQRLVLTRACGAQQSGVAEAITGFDRGALREQIRHQLDTATF